MALTLPNIDYRRYAGYAALVVALALVFVVGHRAWFHSSIPVVVEQPSEWDQPAPKAPKAPKKHPAKRKPAPVERPRVVPTPAPELPKSPWPMWHRDCDENGWCWTWFGWAND